MSTRIPSEVAAWLRIKGEKWHLFNPSILDLGASRDLGNTGGVWIHFKSPSTSADWENAATVKRKKCFVDYKNSLDFPLAQGWVDNDWIFRVNCSLKCGRWNVQMLKILPQPWTLIYTSYTSFSAVLFIFRIPLQPLHGWPWWNVYFVLIASAMPLPEQKITVF